MAKSESDSGNAAGIKGPKNDSGSAEAGLSAPGALRGGASELLASMRQKLKEARMKYEQAASHVRDGRV